MEYPRLGTITKQQEQSILFADAARWIQALHQRRGNPTTAGELFLSTWPNTLAAPLVKAALLDGTLDDLVTKAGVGAARTDDPTWAGNLQAPAFVQPLIDAMKKATVLERLGLVKAPLNTPIPIEGVAPSIAWVAQGAPKPVSKMTINNATIPIAKCSGILVLTAELMRFSTGAELVLSNALVRAATEFVDHAFLDPSVAAVANQNPASITNGLTPVAAGATIDATIAALIAAFFAARPNAIRPVLVASPQTAAKIVGTGNNDQASVEGGSVSGIPLVVSVGAGTALVLLDAAAVAFNDDGGGIDISEFAVVAMDTAPTGATVLRSLWQHNETGVQLDRWISWAKAANAAQYAVLP